MTNQQLDCDDGGASTREVVIVPHTHWDREWYGAFQTFRMKLVDLLDDLLTLLEADPGYAHFMLDGQMAVIDDYLAIRPEHADRLRHLAVSGRLGMGPWYILMDEFLVSGETLVRNLQLGLTRAAEFGGASEVGYLPDMFGHVAQMPQILRQFGLEHAVVWRGVPSAIDKTGFWWDAPDGSRVRAEYLPEGYGNGAALPSDAKDLLALIERFEHRHGHLLVGPILWMNGTDHLMPQPWLGRVVAEVNDLQDDYRLRVSSLGDYVRAAPTTDLPGWTGELRSGSRANLLMGVASNRIDVKQAAAAAERQIERYAEPLSALFLPADRWPSAFLDAAWLEIIRSSAHDSSCACSIDEVCDAVLVRYQEARQIGDGLTSRAVDAIVRSLANAGPVAINTTSRTRSGVMEARLPGHEPVEGTQVLKLSGGEHTSDGINVGDLATLVQTALDNMPGLHDASIETDSDGVFDIRLYYDATRAGEHYSGPAQEMIERAAAEDPSTPARMSIVTPPTQRVLVYMTDVPAFGWSRWRPGPLPMTVSPVEVCTNDDNSGRTIVTNGAIAVSIDPLDGTFALTDGTTGETVTGLGNLVDDGDCGDTYNYNPPFVDAVVDAPVDVTVRVLEGGPLRAVVAVDRRYLWPETVVANCRSGERSVDVTSTIVVEAGRRLVTISTELDNQSRDHRLRAWFPLPRATTTSRAECAFGVVERGIDAEGGPTEKALPTYPSRRFVCAGGLTLVHDGLLEYELVDIRDYRDGGHDDDVPAGSDRRAAHAIAITLLRCTGLISQGPMAYRPLPAGPVTAAADAQMPGRRVLRYGVQLGDDITGPAGAYATADAAFVPLLAGRSRGWGDGPDSHQALTVTGAEVSAVRRDAGQLQVRVFNPSPERTTVHIDGRTGWLTDLRGRPTSPFEGSFDLGPFEITTAILSETRPHP